MMDWTASKLWSKRHGDGEFGGRDLGDSDSDLLRTLTIWISGGANLTLLSSMLGMQCMCLRQRFRAKTKCISVSLRRE